LSYIDWILLPGGGLHPRISFTRKPARRHNSWRFEGLIPLPGPPQQEAMVMITPRDFISDTDARREWRVRDKFVRRAWREPVRVKM
jgi:hypothetical protein